MMQPRVSFVLATFNRGRVLVECLEKLQANAGLLEGEYEILVVDNASTDNTVQLLAEIPHVRVLKARENLGPVAKNFAIAEAAGEFVVLLDDDAYPLRGSVERMLRHFAADPALGAAVFDVTLPDGSREASALPDVFIGAGTGFRRDLLQALGGLPMDYFMQAEEYDLSFRLLRAGYSVQRFGDMPLVHLKTPGARVATRTTRLDVRNNLYLLARYVPAPLCHELAADWLSRYWMMAAQRDRLAGGSAHRAAYMQGAAEGLARWSAKRGDGKHLLPAWTLERIFRFEQIHAAMAEAELRGRRIVLGEFGKDMLAFYRAAGDLGLTIVAIADDRLADADTPRDYRGIPILPWRQVRPLACDAVIMTNISPVHGPAHAAELRQLQPAPVLELLRPRADETPGSLPSAGWRPALAVR